ncbi:hypothetical protein P7L78_26560 [Tistrella bauzanensis]|uniref:hypothetical protein n=1 Tax=Tistrella TaxID=171436 RepID=UPI0031F60C5E
MADYPITVPALWVEAMMSGIKTQIRHPSPRPHKPGDRLWVKEAHALHHAYGQRRADELRWGPWHGLPMAIAPTLDRVCYYRHGFDRADPPRWRPGTSMPRWASRATLVVTDVRAHRLSEIDERDIIAEGVRVIRMPCDLADRYALEPMTPAEVAGGRPAYVMPQIAYAVAWDRIYGRHGTWGRRANPWVVATTFSYRAHNIDKVPS